MADHPTAMARVGKYLMLDLLGEGAFGKVRLAIDETTGAEYAIKIMQKSHIKANELTLQVRREIAVMKAMRHPNIVNLHEVLTSSNNLYMVMDLVTGGELFHVVAEEGRIPESLTRSYFQQLVDGVHYCHSRRVYHRDLKPENLLLSADKQTLKITDFGLSSIKAQNASSELLHTIMGSPHYIAPEIITSAANGYEGAKVDVWAAGVILFGMLAGFLPFDQPNTRALYKAIVQDSVKYPPHFSYDVIKLLKAMLQKDPHKRATMEQVKTFAWFKVNYSPAVTGDEKMKISDKGERRKLRHKLRKHGERTGKKKKDKDDDLHSRLDALKHGRRKREMSDSAETTEDAKFLGKSSIVVEVSTNNLGADAPHVATHAASSGSHDSERHTKENVDPAKQITDTVTSRDTKSAQPVRSFSDRSDTTRTTRGNDGTRMFSRPSNQVRSFGRSSDASRSKSGEGSGKGLDTGLHPGRSFTKLSNVARSFTKSRFRNSSSSGQLSKDVSQSSIGKRESSATIIKTDSSNSRPASPPSPVDSSHSRVASFSSQASASKADASRDAERPTTVTSSQSGANMTSDLQSAATDSDTSAIQERRLSSQASSHAVAETSETKETQTTDTTKATSVPSLSMDYHRGSDDEVAGEDDGGSDEFAGEGDSSASPGPSKGGRSSSSEFEPASLTAFISPVSMSSRTSFKSIAHKRKMPGSNMKTGLALTNLESPLSPQEIHTPRAVVPHADEESGVASVRGFDDGVTPVSSHVSSAIFKPMTGLLESLAQQTPKTNKESMSPSVFCPEVEEGDDVEGTSEWCIDSVEVFADVESPEQQDDATEEGAAVEETRQPDVTNAMEPDLLQRMESSRISIIEAAKPIFAPLSEELELKLSPSMEAEAVVTAEL